MARILLLGPDRERAAGIRSLLGPDGHQVTWSRSTKNWKDQEREISPELVIAAVASPDRVLDAADRPGRGFAAPLLFVQRESDFTREPYLESRLVDRLASPFMREEFLARVDALIRVRSVVHRSPRERPPAQPREDLGRRFSRWLRSRLPCEERPEGPYLEVAARVADWADRRDAFVPGHAGRVTSFCTMIAEGLSMAEPEKTDLLRAAMLHDIGKVALPVEVLHQKRPLDDNQRRLIRTHPARGAALLRALGPDENVARVVLYHHERPDGTGYYGKRADAVPRAAHALAVAETYDAMISSRVRETLDETAALEGLEAGRGSTFDADCVDALADQLRPRRSSIPLSRPI